MSYKASIIITAIIALVSLPFASAATIHHSMLFCKGETEKRQALTPDDLTIFAKNKSSQIIEEIYGGKQRNPNDIISEEEHLLPNKSTELKPQIEPKNKFRNCLTMCFGTSRFEK